MSASGTKDEIHVRELVAIAEILLGVAYADRRFDAVEFDAIRAILGDFAHVGELPEAVSAAIRAFDADTFELSASVAQLEIRADNKLPLLQMVLGVADADRVRDPAEQHYFHRLATAIGASSEEVEALLAE